VQITNILNFLNFQSEELGRKNREIMLAIEQQRLEFQLFQDEMRKQQEEAFRRLGLFESRVRNHKRKKTSLYLFQ